MLVFYVFLILFHFLTIRTIFSVIIVSLLIAIDNLCLQNIQINITFKRQDNNISDKIFLIYNSH